MPNTHAGHISLINPAPMNLGAQTSKPTGPIHTLGAFSTALLLCTLSTPSAHAQTFGQGDSSNNPFFFNSQSATSSWTLYLEEAEQTNWATEDSPPCLPEDGLCVSAINLSDVVIAGSGDSNSTTAWTSRNASIPYYISFSWQFDELSDSGTSTPFYNVNGTTTSLDGVSGSIASATLDPGSSLTFGIANVDGFGDLTISNFNATPVPAPLPLLGFATAFRWSRRLRARHRTGPKQTPTA
jgi:hypothetical protein